MGGIRPPTLMPGREKGAKLKSFEQKSTARAL
jgi:hypothetical protein